MSDDTKMTITTTTTVTTTTPTATGEARMSSSDTSPSALLGSFTKVNLLDNVNNPLSFDQNKTLDNYHGYRLFCRYDVEPMGSPPVDTLIIDLGNAPTGIRTSTAPGKPATQATLRLRYDSHVVTIAGPVPVNYNGGLLAIGAQVSATTKWTNAVLTLTIKEQDVSENDTTLQVPGYVIVETDTPGNFELRWIDNPVFMNAEKPSAKPIPHGPGGGVAGPMGIEAP